MSFDPTKPETGSPLVSQLMREQFNGLKALIDAVPAGPPGAEGPVGPVFSNIQIGTVTTGAPGAPAGASVSINGNNVELSFTIPQGDPGVGGVTPSDLAIAVAGTARNPSTVVPLSMSVSNPPMQGEVEAVIAKLNELIAALMR